MDYAKYTGCSGDQVSYRGHDDPRGILVKDKRYEIEDLEIYDYYSKIKLKGIEGKFNSVCFEFSEKVWDRYKKEQGW